MSVDTVIPPVAAPARAAASSGARPRAAHGLLDRFGAFLGIACAIHCVVVPLALGVLPTLGLGLLADERLDLAIVATAVVAAAVAARLGWRVHRDGRIVASFAGAVSLLVVSHAVGESHVAARALSVAGGLALAASHLWNTRRSRRCALGPGDGHDHAGHDHASAPPVGSRRGD